jgi:hypothetical protein
MVQQVAQDSYLVDTGQREVLGAMELPGQVDKEELVVVVVVDKMEDYQMPDLEMVVVVVVVVVLRVPVVQVDMGVEAPLLYS